MKEVPQTHHDEIGGGTVYQPWCPPPDEIGFPQVPGCPTDPPPPESGNIDPTAVL